MATYVELKTNWRHNSPVVISELRGGVRLCHGDHILVAPGMATMLLMLYPGVLEIVDTHVMQRNIGSYELLRKGVVIEGASHKEQPIADGNKADDKHIDAVPPAPAEQAPNRANKSMADKPRRRGKPALAYARCNRLKTG